MAGFFAVRPVRDTVGTLIGADRLANLWIGTAAASVVVIPVYGWLVARFRRSVFLPWTYAAVAVSLADRRPRVSWRWDSRITVEPVFLDLHQRSQPVHDLGLLELPPGTVPQRTDKAAVRDHCRRRDHRSARRSAVHRLRGVQDWQQRHPVSRCRALRARHRVSEGAAHRLEVRIRPAVETGDLRGT